MNMDEMSEPDEVKREQLAKTRRARENKQRAENQDIRNWETKAALSNWEPN